MKSIFSIRKILQALYYLQFNSTCKDRYGKMYLLKLIYFADRYHLRHFGFVPSSDVYVAMEYGPVASSTYDILKKKMPINANSYEFDLISFVEEKNENEVEIKKQDNDELSKSYIQALDFALKNYGKFNGFELSKITHCYPEWKKHEKTLKSGILQVPMNFIDFFDNPKNIKNDPFKDDKEFLQLMRDEYCENI